MIDDVCRRNTHTHSHMYTHTHTHVHTHSHTLGDTPITAQEQDESILQDEIAKVHHAIIRLCNFSVRYRTGAMIFVVNCIIVRTNIV